MANQIHTLWTDQAVVPPSPLTAGEPVCLLTSAEISNTTFNSFKLTAKVKDLLPDLGGGLGSYYLFFEIEQKDDLGNWVVFPAYQGQPIRKDSDTAQRVIIVQPNLNPQNLGETDIQFRGPKEICHTNRHQGTLPDSPIRVCLYLIEDVPGGGQAFVSATVSAELEQYTV